MTGTSTQLALVVSGILATLLTITLATQSAVAEGGARRDLLRQRQFVQDAFTHAVEAKNFGNQGAAGKLVTHAEISLQQAMRGGNDPHLAEAIVHLREAIEHGRAGHADQATKHAEGAITHLFQIK